ncbi:MAG: 50S ribosomal protein L25 [Planctomycetota bacterium]
MVTKLKTELRNAVGTRLARKLRAEGRIPANLQHTPDAPHINLSIDNDEFMAARRKHEHVFELMVDGHKEPALVNQLHWDTFGEFIQHIEFRRVDLTKKARVEVPLEYVGHPKGVLNHLVTRIAIMTLPTAIPDLIECSVADLEIGTTIYAKSLVMPKGCELAADPELIVARISAVKIEVEAAPAADATAPAASSVAAPVKADAAGAAAGAAGAKPEAGKKDAAAPKPAPPKK